GVDAHRQDAVFVSAHVGDLGAQRRIGACRGAEIIVAGDFLGGVGDRAVPIGRVQERAEDATQDRVRLGIAVAGGERQKLVWALVHHVVVVAAVLNRTACGRRAVVSV